MSKLRIKENLIVICSYFPSIMKFLEYVCNKDSDEKRNLNIWLLRVRKGSTPKSLYYPILIADAMGIRLQDLSTAKEADLRKLLSESPKRTQRNLSPENFRYNFLRHCKTRHIHRKDIANATGLSLKTLKSYCVAHHHSKVFSWRTPSLSSLIVIADCLDVSIDDLLAPPSSSGTLSSE